jgi:protein-tyrosine phosphatase
MGLDLKSHRSRRLTADMMHEADVIYCMTRGHQQAVRELVPSAATKTLLLDPNGDVEDPIGTSPTLYQRCAEVIRRRIEQRLKEQLS